MHKYRLIDSPTFLSGIFKDLHTAILRPRWSEYEIYRDQEISLFYPDIKDNTKKHLVCFLHIANQSGLLPLDRYTAIFYDNEMLPVSELFYKLNKYCLKDYQEACNELRLVKFITAIPKLDKLANLDHVEAFYANLTLASIYIHGSYVQVNDEKALNYLKKAFEIAKKLKDYINVRLILLLLATSLFMAKETDRVYVTLVTDIFMFGAMHQNLSFEDFKNLMAYLLENQHKFNDDNTQIFKLYIKQLILQALACKNIYKYDLYLYIKNNLAQSLLDDEILSTLMKNYAHLGTDTNKESFCTDIFNLSNQMSVRQTADINSAIALGDICLRKLPAKHKSAADWYLSALEKALAKSNFSLYKQAFFNLKNLLSAPILYQFTAQQAEKYQSLTNIYSLYQAGFLETGEKDGLVKSITGLHLIEEATTSETRDKVRREWIEASIADQLKIFESIINEKIQLFANLWIVGHLVKLTKNASTEVKTKAEQLIKLYIDNIILWSEPSMKAVTLNGPPLLLDDLLLLNHLVFLEENKTFNFNQAITYIVQDPLLFKFRFLYESSTERTNATKAVLLIDLQKYIDNTSECSLESFEYFIRLLIENNNMFPLNEALIKSMFDLMIRSVNKLIIYREKDLTAFADIIQTNVALLEKYSLPAKQLIEKIFQAKNTAAIEYLYSHNKNIHDYIKQRTPRSLIELYELCADIRHQNLSLNRLRFTPELYEKRLIEISCHATDISTKLEAKLKLADYYASQGKPNYQKIAEICLEVAYLAISHERTELIPNYVLYAFMDLTKHFETAKTKSENPEDWALLNFTTNLLLYLINKQQFIAEKRQLFAGTRKALEFVLKFVDDLLKRASGTIFELKPQLKEYVLNQKKVYEDNLLADQIILLPEETFTTGYKNIFVALPVPKQPIIPALNTAVPLPPISDEAQVSNSTSENLSMIHPHASVPITNAEPIYLETHQNSLPVNPETLIGQEIAHLKHELAAKSAESDDKQHEINMLKQKLNATQSELYEANNKNKTLEEKNAQLNAELQTARSHIKNTSDELLQQLKKINVPNHNPQSTTKHTRRLSG